MKKTRAKKFKVRLFYHLQNLFWGVFVRGVFGLGVLSRGFLSEGLCPGVFVQGFFVLNTPSRTGSQRDQHFQILYIYFLIYRSAWCLQSVIRLSKYISMIEHNLYIYRKKENALFTIY